MIYIISFFFFAPRLAEVSDKCEITDRNGLKILMAAAEAFGCNTKTFL